MKSLWLLLDTQVLLQKVSNSKHLKKLLMLNLQTGRI
jgi:hypothetical protein